MNFGSIKIKNQSYIGLKKNINPDKTGKPAEKNGIKTELKAEWKAGDRKRRNT